jgi:hypothetical protein
MIARKALCGVAGVAALFATASSASAECAERYYVGEATGIFATTTGIAARADWRGQVRSRVGSEFAYWSRARNRSTRCSRPETGGPWHCVARARPCTD